MSPSLPHQHRHHGASLGAYHAAGSGSAVLDIGDDVGALLAVVPDRFATSEIDITLGHGHSDKPPNSHDVHTGVHPRAYHGRDRQIALFPSLPAGKYQLWHPYDTVALARVEIVGGRVTEVDLSDV
ncbi:hypothetical protein [Williamsia sterculiae]|uniref:Phospholipase n=1 Tax=Williamsia sterculiae TaxID=1344003 RepID=A0A1N7CV14_9NOCA|nr:hypothetical protein [Williamsia sterculiae]SIR67380.1 hypothetical protein SAMN05445060_0379 [Williamsia sterculiae]